MQASVGGLVNLEYLRVEASQEVIVPTTVLKMKKLRHIHAAPGAAYDKDCNSSCENNLEFLSSITVSVAKDEEMLKCSPHLRKLKLLSRRAVDLSFLTQLDSLTIRGYELATGCIIYPSNIRKLTLSQPILSGEQMSMIGRLENLEVLKLEHSGFEGKIWVTRDVEFQKLRFLKLDRVNVAEWSVGSSQHFPKLQRLILRYCYPLPEIPSEIGEITTLELIELKEECQKSLVRSAERIQEEQRDMGNEELKIIIETRYTGLGNPELKVTTDAGSRGIVVIMQ